MQYRTDPKTGNKLSILGLGCMRFPHDRAKTEQIIVSAIEAGVNYFDTAYLYSGSEATLGEILCKIDFRDRVNLATKLPHRKCKSYEDFSQLFSEQLKRLKTDYIDYYLVHHLSDLAEWHNLRDMGIERWIAEKKENGQIKQIGFSFHGSQNEFLALLDEYDWDFCQIQYNYMDENYQAGRVGLHRANEKGLAVIVMEPLLGGKLANALPLKAAKLFQKADANRSAAAWALNWIWNQPEVTTVLSGMNSMEQLEDNLKTAKDARPNMLTKQETAVFIPVVAAIREAYKIPCTGCNYCMPCPNGVNIPGCFAAYNMSYVMGFILGVKQYLNSTRANLQYGPKYCVKCGACERHCPQHIEIIKELEIVKRRMEPFWWGAAARLTTASPLIKAIARSILHGRLSI